MKISDNLREKIALIQKWDDSYYNKNESLISDKKYDLVKDYVLRSLPADSSELEMLQSKVGHSASDGWKKRNHSIFMGSQNKLSSVEDIKHWWTEIFKKEKIDDSATVLQHKIDGFSLELNYRDGKLQRAITRGDGFTGEDITKNVKYFRYVPNVLSIDKKIDVRGEVYLTDEDFESIQKETNNKYENPRNAASGISRRFDGTFCKYLRLAAFDISANVQKETQKREILKKLGFETVKSFICKSIDDILKLYEDYKESLRDNLGFGIDGLVLKFDDISLQEKLGYDKNRPLGQVALKFDSDQAVTVLKDIIPQIGRTGRITPLAILDPVKLMGSTVKKATLHNYGMVNSLLLSPGSEVVIEKKGDIIPQIVDIMSPGKGFSRPDVCPSCRGDLEWDGVNLWCHNEGCREREINRITYWLVSLDIKGFSSSFIKKLWDNGKIRKVSDLYRIKMTDFEGIEGIGKKTVIKFLKALESSSKMFLEKFIVALGIPSVSNSTAEVLVQNFKNWERIRSLKSNDIQNLPGFAEISANTIVKGISDVSDMADELLKVIKLKEKKQTKLTGKSFCVTGSLKNMSRKEFEAFVIEEGGSFKSGVSQGLNYLVTNNPDSGTGKIAKAKKINEKLKDSPEDQINIIKEVEFFEMAGGVPEDIEEEEKDPSQPQLEFNPLF